MLFARLNTHVSFSLFTFMSPCVPRFNVTWTVGTSLGQSLQTCRFQGRINVSNLRESLQPLDDMTAEQLLSGPRGLMSLQRRPFLCCLSYYMLMILLLYYKCIIIQESEKPAGKWQPFILPIFDHFPFLKLLKQIRNVQIQALCLCSRATPNDPHIYESNARGYFSNACATKPSTPTFLWCCLTNVLLYLWG